MPINFFFDGVEVKLKNRRKLKHFIKQMFINEGKRDEVINYIFCSDKAILKINQDYLQHDYYTDIITFELSEPNKPMSAEIYISIERIVDNANRLNQKFENELHRVMFHGVLHLCGLKDKTPTQKLMMREKENEYLELYNSN